MKAMLHLGVRFTRCVKLATKIRIAVAKDREMSICSQKLLLTTLGAEQP